MRTVSRRLTLLSILAIVVGATVPTTAQSDPASKSVGDQSTCVVVDPTTTPLNVRTAPNGQVIGTIPNGQPVRILNLRNGSHGDLWAYIADNSRPIGWVFREYLVCR